MTTMPHQAPAAVSAPWWLAARNMWASLTISMIWLSVLFTAVFGPNIETFDVSGSHSSVPSAVGVAFFAVFATWVVAKYGFDRRPKDS